MRTIETFTFRVAAQNSYGYGEFSAYSNTQEVYNRPDAPRALLNYPKETNENSIYLTWSNGVSDGGRPILGYKVNVFADAAK